jgi:hypothetical protein
MQTVAGELFPEMSATNPELEGVGEDGQYEGMKDVIVE